MLNKLQKDSCTLSLLSTICYWNLSHFNKPFWILRDHRHMHVSLDEIFQLMWTTFLHLTTEQLVCIWELHTCAMYCSELWCCGGKETIDTWWGRIRGLWKLLELRLSGFVCSPSSSLCFWAHISTCYCWGCYSWIRHTLLSQNLLGFFPHLFA